MTVARVRAVTPVLVVAFSLAPCSTSTSNTSSNPATMVNQNMSLVCISIGQGVVP